MTPRAAGEPTRAPRRASAPRASGPRHIARPLRVVMLLENNPYPQDTRVRNEAESLVAAGHRVTVLAPRERGQRRCEHVNGVCARRYRPVWAGRSALSYGVEYAIAHAQLLTRGVIELARGADVLHFHGPPDTMFLAGVCARLAGRKVVFDLHDTAPELFAAKFGSSRVAMWALRAAQRQAVRWADHVIVTNQSQLELVQALGRRSAIDVSIVRNGPRVCDFRTPPAARTGAIDAPRLIYVGALDTQDGVLELAEMLATPPLSRATLTIAGDGPVREELERRLRALGVQERVTLTGRVPHSQIPRLIAQADIGIDPASGSALNHGSTMIKVMEYMGAARPLVAYDLRETRRSAGEAALYAPCGEPSAFAARVAELALDEDRRMRMGRIARRRALELSWERSAKVLEEVYEQLRGSGEHRRVGGFSPAGRDASGVARKPTGSASVSAP
jgi:glycosyltransferase involved in cell wall biosynthesis